MKLEPDEKEGGGREKGQATSSWRQRRWWQEKKRERMKLDFTSTITTVMIECDLQLSGDSGKRRKGSSDRGEDLKSSWV